MLCLCLIWVDLRLSVIKYGTTGRARLRCEIVFTIRRYHPSLDGIAHNLTIGWPIHFIRP
jgi:hypothetical protein